MLPYIAYMDPMGNGMCTKDYKNSSTILSISFYIFLYFTVKLLVFPGLAASGDLLR